MTWERQTTVAFGAAFWIGFLGIPTALLSGRPEVLVIALPFAALALFAAVTARQPDLDIALDVDADRALEDDDVGARAVLTSARGAPLVRLTVVSSIGEQRREFHAIGASVPPGARTTVPVPVMTQTWGVETLEVVAADVIDRLGVVRHTAHIGRTRQLRIYPAPDRLRTLVAPRVTPPRRGSLPARQVGDGLEFASTRPFRSGDQARAINWRATARRQRLWVSEFHDERSADVVLFVDALRGAGTNPDGGLIAAVRAADVLAQRYLREHGRVGLVTFGTTVRWLQPSVGLRQQYQVAEVLVEAEAQRTIRWQDIEAVPRQVIPPGALVLILSPLVHPRIFGAITNLRGRGHDLAVLDVSAFLGIEPEPDDLAQRLFLLQRAASLTALAERGVLVTPLEPDRPLAQALEEVQASRRYAVS